MEISNYLTRISSQRRFEVTLLKTDEIGDLKTLTKLTERHSFLGLCYPFGLCAQLCKVSATLSTRITGKINSRRFKCQIRKCSRFCSLQRMRLYLHRCEGFLINLIIIYLKETAASYMLVASFHFNSRIGGLGEYSIGQGRLPMANENMTPHKEGFEPSDG